VWFSADSDWMSSDHRLSEAEWPGPQRAPTRRHFESGLPGLSSGLPKEAAAFGVFGSGGEVRGRCSIGAVVVSTQGRCVFLEDRSVTCK